MLPCECQKSRAESRQRRSHAVRSGVALFIVSLMVCLGATGARARGNGLIKSLSSLPQTVRGECKMVPDTTRGGLANSKQVPASLQGVGIDQRLNNQIPLNLTFRNSTGNTVRLGDYFGKKPVILSLVYFNCPMLCTMEENGLLNVLKLMKFTVGKQFSVVTVSFDPHDTPEMALDKKRMYLS